MRCVVCLLLLTSALFNSWSMGTDYWADWRAVFFEFVTTTRRKRKNVAAALFLFHCGFRASQATTATSPCPVQPIVWFLHGFAGAWRELFTSLDMFKRRSFRPWCFCNCSSWLRMTLTHHTISFHATIFPASACQKCRVRDNSIQRHCKRSQSVSTF